MADQFLQGKAKWDTWGEEALVINSGVNSWPGSVILVETKHMHSVWFLKAWFSCLACQSEELFAFASLIIKWMLRSGNRPLLRHWAGRPKDASQELAGQEDFDGFYVKLTKKDCFWRKVTRKANAGNHLHYCCVFPMHKHGWGRKELWFWWMIRGLHDGTTYVPECGMIALGECISVDKNDAVTGYILAASSSSPDSPLISSALLFFVWGNVRGKAS